MVVNFYSNADFKLVYCRVVLGNFLRIVYICNILVHFRKIQFGLQVEIMK